MTRLRPVLDDVTYAELLAGAMARIPAVAPDWTDHNPTDPGIIVLELFAWLAEMLVYRADQITEDRYRAFLALLGGPVDTAAGEVDAAIAETLRALRTPWRAATAADVEHLLRVEWPRQPEASAFPTIRRVSCVPRRDLASDPTTDRPGLLSVIVVAEPPPGTLPAPDPKLCAAVHAWLEPRRLLGVRHRVVGPTYVPVRLTARLVLRAGFATEAVARSGVLTDAAILADVAQRAGALVATYLDPLTGSADGRGWPFGRNVYLSELYRVLDGLPGVDHVDALGFVDLPADRVLAQSGEVVGARVEASELVAATAVDGAGVVGRLTVALADDGRLR